MSELATNAVVHARTPMRLSVLRQGPRIRVEVRDDDPERPVEMRPDPLALGGRGVYLVHALATDWGVNANHRGKTVWFEM